MIATVELSTATVVAVIGSLATAVGVLFKLVISSKNETLRATKSLLKSYKEIAEDTTRSLTQVVNQNRLREGKLPIQLTVPVVTESQSPSTELQRHTAHVATLRAHGVQLNKAAGLPPPREEPDKA